MAHNLWGRGRLFLRRSFTLMIVPPRGARARSFQVPGWLLVLSGCLLVMLLTVAAGSWIRAVHLRREAAQLKQLQAVHNRQQEQLAQLQREACSARRYLQEVRTLEQRVREKTGLQTGGGYSSRWGGGRDDRLQLSLLKVLFDRQEVDPGEVGAALEKTIGDATELRETLKRLESDLDARQQYLAALPDNWPVSGEVSSPFGSRPSPFGGGHPEYHDGLDLAVPFGTQVHAAGAGVVVFAGYRPAYGQVVTISHGYGYRSSYCHLSKILVKVGDRLGKGDTLGLVGSTGRSTGPHLHFMVEKGGVLVDPLTLLKK